MMNCSIEGCPGDHELHGLEELAPPGANPFASGDANSSDQLDLSAPFSTLPVLAATLTGKPNTLTAWQSRLQRMDHALVDALPFLGRYCWETVIVLER